MTMKEYDAVFCHGLVATCLKHLVCIRDSEHHEPWIPRFMLDNVIGELVSWRGKLEEEIKVQP